ncbi:MAG TPA: Glu-tRNA(Gln) amidotransferase subunit GatD [Candidatus Nitrosotalea sp.]|nr:Glu-tRNA(Gln) amidotransferase subunit GatD [Nitrososphaerota archaeon]HKU32991.1 Glu-tRNA(Gln) amidotransferase subunit GatD [Candidatus Nitrosotalea sp.]
MSYSGYRGKSLELLKKNNVEVGSLVKVQADSTYSGILMPRYEYSDDEHIVLKLKNGYNIGLEIGKISKIEIESHPSMKKEIVSHSQTNPKLPKILLISTGGTIASRIDYRTGGVTPALTADELNASVPELSKIANIDTEVLFSEYSENLLPEHWIKIAEKLNSCARSEYKGIIVAHGTDTMQYTAAALSFSLSGFPKPVALVGSQRSSDRPSSDAALNLISAAKFLVETDTSGIFVVMHNSESDDEVACHWGTRVRKNHTSKRNAFQTVGGSPAFIVKKGSIEKNPLFNSPKKTFNPKINFNDKVMLMKYYPGLDPTIMDHLISSGYKAIIFEGTGLGHVGKVMYKAIEDAKRKELFVGMTSQCIDGIVRMTVYDSGRDLLNLGVVPLGNMIPETALVKAMWAAGNARDINEMEKMMKENVSLEISD